MKAIEDASELVVPVAIQGSFKSKSIEAKAWVIQLEQGATINILVHWQTSDSSKLIVDLLAGPDWRELKSFAVQNDSVKFEADKTGSYLLRIQPELLGEGNFQVRINGVATYAVFPVEGKNSTAIQSVWGDDRDGGKRSHEGVDIFAARGTPVLSPVQGVVTAVRDPWIRRKTGLGERSEERLESLFCAFGQSVCEQLATGKSWRHIGFCRKYWQCYNDSATFAFWNISKRCDQSFAGD